MKMMMMMMIVVMMNDTEAAEQRVVEMSNAVVASENAVGRCRRRSTMVRDKERPEDDFRRVVFDCWDLGRALSRKNPVSSLMQPSCLFRVTFQTLTTGKLICSVSVYNATSCMSLSQHMVLRVSFSLA